MFVKYYIHWQLRREGQDTMFKQYRHYMSSMISSSTQLLQPMYVSCVSHAFDQTDGDVIYYYGRKYRSEESVNRMMNDIQNRLNDLKEKLKQQEELNRTNIERLIVSGDEMTTNAGTFGSECVQPSSSLASSASSATTCEVEMVECDDDDDNVSVCSSTSSASFQRGDASVGHVKGNVGKRNQAKYVPDKTLLRHDVHDIGGHKRTWYGMYDADKNIVLRQNDRGNLVGIAYETIRQFAMLHSADVRKNNGGTMQPHHENVWSENTNIRFWCVENNQWMPIHKLKDCKNLNV